MRALTFLFISLSLVVSMCGLLMGASGNTPGTSVTYQGRLIDANSPANDFYDFQFKLYDVPDGESDLAGDIVYQENVPVVDGYFTTYLDFGDNVFDGQSKWLDISVRPGWSTDPNDYVTLTPRQPVTAAPYALYAEAAGGVHGGIDWTDIANRPSGLDDGDDVGLTSETDPQVGENETNYVSKWNGSELVSGSIYDNGYVGIGTTNPDASLDIVGNLAVVNDANNASFSVGNEGGGAHVRFIGGSTVASPSDGDLWYTGSELNFRKGETTTDLLSSGVASGQWQSVSLSSENTKTITGLSSGSFYELKIAITKNDSPGHIRMRINEDAGTNYTYSTIGGDFSGYGSDFKTGIIPILLNKCAFDIGCSTD